MTTPEAGRALLALRDGALDPWSGSFSMTGGKKGFLFCVAPRSLASWRVLVGERTCRVFRIEASDDLAKVEEGGALETGTGDLSQQDQVCADFVRIISSPNVPFQDAWPGKLVSCPAVLAIGGWETKACADQLPSGGRFCQSVTPHRPDDSCVGVHRKVLWRSYGGLPGCLNPGSLAELRLSGTLLCCCPQMWQAGRLGRQAGRPAAGRSAHLAGEREEGCSGCQPVALPRDLEEHGEAAKHKPGALAGRGGILR